MITDEEAVSLIQKLIDDAVDEVTGNMGATEYKYYINMCKGIYKDYGYSIRGCMDEFKDIVQQAIEICGFQNFNEIRNTKENRYMIEETILRYKHRFFG